MMIRCGSFVLIVSFALLLRTPAGAQEWTRFRGPNGTGISNATTIPVAISEADYNWRVPLPGKGISSPVIWGQKIFLTSAEEPTGATGKRHLICLNAAEGRTLWTRSYDFPKYRIYAGLNSYASSTPAVDGDHVYVVWTTPDSQTIYALDHSGKDVWKYDLGTGFNCGHGGASSPIVVGDTVILANDQEDKGAAADRKVESFLLGLDRNTGAVRWKRARATSAGENSYATPMVYQPKEGPAEVIFSSTPHGVTSLNPQTGELNWETGNIFKERTVASPIAVNGLIIQTGGVGQAGQGSKLLVAVRPGAKKGGVNPKVEYSMARDIFQSPTPIAVGDRIFAWGEPNVLCIKAGTGEVIWKERVEGRYYGSPVCVNGKLYAMTALGDLVVIEASDSFKILGKSPLGEASHSTPAVANGVMYLRTMSHLISVGGKKNNQ